MPFWTAGRIAHKYAAANTCGDDGGPPWSPQVSFFPSPASDEKRRQSSRAWLRTSKEIRRETTACQVVKGLFL